MRSHVVLIFGICLALLSGYAVFNIGAVDSPTATTQPLSHTASQATRQPDPRPKRVGPVPLSRIHGLAPTPPAAPPYSMPVPRPDLAQLFASKDLPQQRPQQASWNPLSDTQRYRSIFDLQQKGEWVMADSLIAELQNPNLLGYVLYQRYMHPKSQRASWAKLNIWLHNYIELPVAWPIYKMARARKPKTARLPPQPPKRVYDFLPLSAQYFPDAKSRAIRNHVMRLCKRGYPTGAHRYLSRARTRQALTASQRYFLTLRIVYSYMTLGYPQKAQALAQSMLMQRSEFPIVDWYMGFAAWRLQHIETAAYYFAAIANNPQASLRERAKGAYWAARSYGHLGRKFETRHYLARASGSGISFYSLLAQQRLTGRIQILWQRQHHPKPKHLISLKQYAAVQRAVLLTQAKQHGYAEMELLRLLDYLPIDDIPALQFFAQQEGYAGVEVAAARKLEKLTGHKDSGSLSQSLYPIAPYIDSHGLLVDRALVYALIRQESLFRLTAKSPAGARGLMQLMPATAAYVSGNTQLGKRTQHMRLHDIRTNLFIGQTYLRRLIDDHYRIGDNLIMALGAYNAGPGNMRRWQKKRYDLTDPLTFLESLPANETRLYVTKVLENLWIYQNRLQQPAPSLVALANNHWPLYESVDSKLSMVHRAQN